RRLIEISAQSSQDLSPRFDADREAAGNSVTDKMITVLTDLITKLVTNTTQSQPQQVKACEFCQCITHKTDACPSLQEDVNAVNFQGQRTTPWNNTLDLPWRNHPNFRWGGQSNTQNVPQQQKFPSGFGQGQQQQQQQQFNAGINNQRSS
ncbi:hypothetical protein Droror1_Dr00027190, partial [Drosera rotundifolia]